MRLHSGLAAPHLAALPVDGGALDALTRALRDALDGRDTAPVRAWFDERRGPWRDRAAALRWRVPRDTLATLAREVEGVARAHRDARGLLAAARDLEALATLPHADLLPGPWFALAWELATLFAMNAAAGVRYGPGEARALDALSKLTDPAAAAAPSRPPGRPATSGGRTGPASPCAGSRSATRRCGP